MKKIIFIIFAVLLLAGCSSYTNIQSPTNTETQPAIVVSKTPAPGYSNVTETQVIQEVQIKNFKFIPEVITIKAGTTITWTNEDTAIHLIHNEAFGKYAMEEYFGSENMKKGDSYSFTFNEKGEIPYHCHPHPFMTGKIIVE